MSTSSNMICAIHNIVIRGMFLIANVTMKNKAGIFIQGGFFNWSAQKMTKCQITCKSLQKSSKCQNFLRVWDLVIFKADQLKKPPCR